MADPGVEDRLVVWARTRLAAGDGLGDVLDELRRRGLNMTDSVEVVRVAAGVSRADAIRAAHAIPLWADQAQASEYLTNAFFRAAFIECVLGNGTVNSPPEQADECRERQQRAGEQLQRAAAVFTGPELGRFRALLADGRFGRAFVWLVDLGRQSEMPVAWWRQIAAVAQTLCLKELLDGEAFVNGVEEVRAARLVYQLVDGSRGREDR